MPSKRQMSFPEKQINLSDIPETKGKRKPRKKQMNQKEKQAILNFHQEVQDAWTPQTPVPPVVRTDSYVWYVQIKGDYKTIPLEISTMLEDAYRQGKRKVRAQFEELSQSLRD